MSMEDLLSDSTVTVRLQTVTQDTSGGTVRARSDRLTDVPAWITKPSGRELQQYMSLGMACNYTVITQESGFQKGDVVVASDGRILRMLSKEQVDGHGDIATYYRMPCEEVST